MAVKRQYGRRQNSGGGLPGVERVRPVSGQAELAFGTTAQRSAPVSKTAPTWQTLDTLLILGLGFGTLLSRLPFRAALLSSFDAVNYTLALDHFDMRLAQPQAPGYPLYVLLGRLFSFAYRLAAGTTDHPAALVWLSMVFSGLAVGAIYLAGREMYGRQVGFLAALMLSVSTVFWYMGEIVAPYTVDLFASALVGWLCYRTMRSSGDAPVWSCALAVGLAGALRLQTLVFLFPLFLYSLLNRDGLNSASRRSWPVALAAGALAVLVFAAFFLPAVMASGGMAAFLGAMRGILPIFRDTDTLIRSARWDRFAYNLGTIFRYTFRILGELSLPFLLLGFIQAAGKLAPGSAAASPEPASNGGNRLLRRFVTGHSPRILFLLLWLLPSWMVYILIWPGNLGTLLVSTPPLFVLAALGFASVTIPQRRLGLMAGGLMLAVLLAWSILVFAVLPKAPFGGAYRTFDNYDSLAGATRAYQTRLDLVRNIPVDGTIIYTNDFRHLQYYLPQYHTFSYPRFSKDNPDVIEQVISIEAGKMQAWRNVDPSSLAPKGTRRIVFFEPASKLQLDNRLVVELRSSGEYAIQVVTIPDSHQVYWTPQGLTLR